MNEILYLLSLLEFKVKTIKDTDYYDLTENHYSYSISIQLPSNIIIVREANYKIDIHTSKVMSDKECLCFIKDVFKYKIRQKKIEKLLKQQ